MPQYERAPEPPMFDRTSAFGDFSDVRVHEGSHAPAIGAAAFTQGDHLGSAPQLNLAAHEAAHVVQQARGRVFADQY